MAIVKEKVGMLEMEILLVCVAGGGHGSEKGVQERGVGQRPSTLVLMMINSCSYVY